MSIKVLIPPGCEVAQLIANLTSHLGLKAQGNVGGSDMVLRAWDRYFILNFCDLGSVSVPAYAL